MSKGYKEIKLEAHHYLIGVYFHVVFAGSDWAEAERNALAWMERKSSTLYINEVEGEPLNYEDVPELIKKLYPECPHGLSLSNCYGPQHYYYDEEEQAAGHLNGW
jgi:hypothetical protein